jgi:hypothetical protein
MNYPTRLKHYQSGHIQPISTDIWAYIIASSRAHEKSISRCRAGAAQHLGANSTFSTGQKKRFSTKLHHSQRRHPPARARMPFLHRTAYANPPVGCLVRCYSRPFPSADYRHSSHGISWKHFTIYSTRVVPAITMFSSCRTVHLLGIALCYRPSEAWVGVLCLQHFFFFFKHRRGPRSYIISVVATNYSQDL